MSNVNIYWLDLREQEQAPTAKSAARSIADISASVGITKGVFTSMALMYREPRRQIEIVDQKYHQQKLFLDVIQMFPETQTSIDWTSHIIKAWAILRERLQICVSTTNQRGQITKIDADTCVEKYMVRVVLSYGAGNQQDKKPMIILILSERRRAAWKRTDPLLSLSTSIDTRSADIDFVKNIDRQIYLDAENQARIQNCDGAILCRQIEKKNQQIPPMSKIIEGTWFHIWMRRDKTWYSNVADMRFANNKNMQDNQLGDQQRCQKQILWGATSQRLLETLQKCRETVILQEMTTEDLYKADAVIAVSSLLRWAPVGILDGVPLRFNMDYASVPL